MKLIPEADVVFCVDYIDLSTMRIVATNRYTTLKQARADMYRYSSAFIKTGLFTYKMSLGSTNYLVEIKLQLFYTATQKRVDIWQ